MIRISPYHLLHLSSKEGALCLSMYGQSEKDLAYLMGRAEEIGLKTHDPKTIDRLLRPVHLLSRKGLALPRGSTFGIFTSLDFSGYTLLPTATEPLAVVAPSFHIKPLLRYAQQELPFLVLDLQETEAVLHQGSMSYFEEIDRISFLRLRTLDGLFSAFDHAAFQASNGRRLPLILAGDLDLADVYRKVSTYPGLGPAFLPLSGEGGPGHHALHRAALAALESTIEGNERRLIEEFRSAEKKGQASSALKEIIQLVNARKVDHLLIHERMRIWAKKNPDTQEFTFSLRQTEATDDLLDDLAQAVLGYNGKVTVLPAGKMPKGRPACAILKKEREPKSGRIYLPRQAEAAGPVPMVC